VEVGGGGIAPNEEVSRAELCRQVAELQHRVERLDSEMRTRRLAVVDDEGRERLVAEAVGEVLEVRMDLPTEGPRGRTGLVCFTTPGDGELSAGLGAQVWVRGDLAGEVSWWADRASDSPRTLS
jgi:hypothetical protein